MSPAVPPVRKPGLFERLWRCDPRPNATAPPGRPSLFRIGDWRLVAAVGLPLWAFLIGFIAARQSAPAAPAPSPAEVATFSGPNGQTEPPAPAPVESIPAPREVVIRTEVVTVPVAVPVLAPSEPVAAAPEFALPPSEVLPADRCKTFDTKVRFHAGLPEAAEEAKLSKKMLLVLHISGNFDDPGFT